MLSFEEVQEYLTKLADSIPEPVYRQLNGGILLLPETRPHPQGQGDDLWILGEYRYEPAGFGRYIVIYYGSLCRVCGHLSEEAQKRRLSQVLRHELTHHLEHLAGDRSLEVRDAEDMARYRMRHRRDDP